VGAKTKEDNVITADLNQLELMDFTVQSNEKLRCKATFPLLGAMGTKDCCAVYFELAPGNELPRHTDSAEEVLYILEGEAEASVGDESARVKQGQLVVVPKMAPHGVRNVGDTTVRVLGFFGGANNFVATFEETWDQVNSNVVDTAAMGGA
jgi:quercetin dioxygenase-like cupin family protein